MWLLLLAFGFFDPVAIEDPPLPPAPPTIVESEVPVASIEVTDAMGQPVTGECAVGQMLLLKSEKAVHAKIDGSLTWIIDPELQSFTTDGGKTLVLNTGLQPGVLRIMQIVSTTSGKNTYQRLSIRIGSAPQPPPVVDPDDPPAPEPPLPEPQPTKLRVLIIEETATRVQLPPSQVAVFTSTDIREYARKNCSKGPDGKTADFRIYDKDVAVSKEPQWVQSAFAEPRQKLPWIVLSNGVTGFSGPLPESPEATLELLKKYGGP